MTTISATEARNNIGKLWDKASNGPVTVLSAGEPVAVVLSPAEYEKLTARKQGAKAGFAKHLMSDSDVRGLLATNIDDVFEDYR